MERATEDAAKFGLRTLTRALHDARELLLQYLKAAERAGFDFLSVSDHLVVSANFTSTVPTTGADHLF